MAAVNTRVQLSNADRKVVCELARDNKDLSQDKLTPLAAPTLKQAWFETSHSRWHLEQER